MDLTTIFQDLARPPARNYTLGETLAARRGWAINTNPLNFTTAGRAVERVHMAAGVVTALFAAAGMAVAAVPAVPALAVTAGMLGGYKVMGIAAGKLVDIGVRRAAAL